MSFMLVDDSVIDFDIGIFLYQETLSVESPNEMIDGTSSSNMPLSEHGLTCLSWCDSPFETPRLAIGGYSKRAVIWVQKGFNKWVEVIKLK